MASRPVMIASLLGASVGVPYLASQSQHKATTLSAMSSSSVSKPATYAGYSSASFNSNGNAVGVGSPASSAWNSPSVATTQSWASAPQLLPTTTAVSAMPVSMAGGGSITRLPVTGTTTVVPTAVGVVSPQASATDGAQFTSAGQILRFDVTKEWVC